MRVLVTGASGFVGLALIRRLVGESGCRVRASTRGQIPWPNGVESVIVPDVGPDSDWGEALAGVDVVVHLAARVHVMTGDDAGRAAEYDRVNVRGSQRLAEQAHAAGVRRLIVLSSVKVHGDEGAFTENSPMAPADPYGVSKRDGEAAVREVATHTGLEVVVIRSPLVYGPGVKGNFLSLISAVRKGVPLPLASVQNRRSFVGVENLVDLIATCLTHPSAKGEAFLVSDDDDLSTPDLVRRLATAVGVPVRVFPVPVGLLEGGAALVGRRHVAQRLTGSLTVDITKARRVLGWNPPCPMPEQLRRMIAAD